VEWTVGWFDGQGGRANHDPDKESGTQSERTSCNFCASSSREETRVVAANDKNQKVERSSEEGGSSRGERHRAGKEAGKKKGGSRGDKLGK